MIGIGSAATSTAGYDPNLVNFPNDKGKVSAVISGAFGLSSALFSGLYSLFYKEDVPSFLISLGIICGGVCCLGSLFLISEKNEKHNEIEDKSAFAPLLNPETAGQHQHPSLVFGHDVNTDFGERVLYSAPRLEDLPTYEDDIPFDDDDDFSPLVEDMNGLQSIRTLNFWLLFFAFLGSTGTSSTILNALSSILVSIGGHEGQQDLMITLNAFACFTGTFTQTLLDSISQVLQGLCFAACLFASPFWWYIIIPVFGFAYGLVWAAVPA
eukprot:CAMPEP_0168549940 /NCGR_PEP_ID=MMETSP0413-20121227/5373_1 /TAXON_ID=136452 /ORGANISM="Filamoeba nolandi, Strain NC-AS-23-1" /LENGTH=267 /DNA_ID=CAMNT_0008580365 /DNA_START=267 /DNA_END=1067 /DNA_ORIENTATION=+